MGYMTLAYNVQAPVITGARLASNVAAMHIFMSPWYLRALPAQTAAVDTVAVTTLAPKVPSIIAPAALAADITNTVEQAELTFVRRVYQFTRIVIINISDNIGSISDTVVKFATKVISDSDGSISDSLVKKAIKPISDTDGGGAITDSVVKKALKAITDSDGSISDALAAFKVRPIHISDNLGGITDSVVRGASIFHRHITDSLGAISDSIRRKKIIPGLVTLVPVLGTLGGAAYTFVSNVAKSISIGGPRNDVDVTPSS